MQRLPLAPIVTLAAHGCACVTGLPGLSASFHQQMPELVYLPSALLLTFLLLHQPHAQMHHCCTGPLLGQCSKQELLQAGCLLCHLEQWCFLSAPGSRLMSCPHLLWDLLHLHRCSLPAVQQVCRGGITRSWVKEDRCVVHSPENARMQEPTSSAASLFSSADMAASWGRDTAADDTYYSVTKCKGLR